MTETQEQTEGNRLLPVAIDRPLNGMDEAWRLAKNLAVASLMPQSLHGKPSDILALLMYGQDLGLSPMQAIQGIYVVKGHPQLSGVTWIALARRAGHKVRMIESTAERCTIQITRNDDPDYPHTETFTIDDAIKAALCRRDEKTGKIMSRSQKGDPLPWEAYTQTMLRNRAISNAGKFACPEVATGFAIEGDWDSVPDSPVDVTQPEMHRAPIPAADLAAEVARAEAEFNQPSPDIEDAVIIPDEVGPTEEDIAAMNAEAAADIPIEEPPTGLFGDPE